jgi:MoaA/NifB/PqqE/SkfB family radical SAM enzyme
MTLTGIHILLTYACTRECDHCFLFGSPKAPGKFSIEQIGKILVEAKKIGTVEIIFFEGGEPFLEYSTMIDGINLARNMGFEVGIVTNGYWARDENTAINLLQPVKEMGIVDLSISDDDFHSNGKTSPAKIALKIAKQLNLPAGNIVIDNPVNSISEGTKGQPIIGGDVRFRGRAVEKLANHAPKRSWTEFTYCSHEELVNPERVHIDPFGNVFLCQGINLGNLNDNPLSKIIKEYDVKKHPIFSFIEKGGPVSLAQQYGIPDQKDFVDECHLCFTVRKNILSDFPDHLGPANVYGLG